MTCSFGTSFEKFDFLGRLRRPRGRILVWLCSGLLAVVCQSQALLKATDNVDGNLITLNPDGNWSWYMDERAIFDATNAKLLISSQTSSNETNIPGGTVHTSLFSGRVAATDIS